MESTYHTIHFLLHISFLSPKATLLPARNLRVHTPSNIAMHWFNYLRYSDREDHHKVVLPFHLHHVDNFLFIGTRSDPLIRDPVLHLNWKSELKYLLIPSDSSHFASFIAPLRPPCQPDWTLCWGRTTSVIGSPDTKGCNTDISDTYTTTRRTGALGVFGPLQGN